VQDPVVIEQLEIEAKYAGYVERQREDVERGRLQEEARLPDDIDYGKIHGLSIEVRQKLNQLRPATLGQATRISGVTPAAVSVLQVYLKRRAGEGRVA
jgi:tRNA uridine 5-carboxymethylaminomethyl modification enzyme